MVYAMHKTGKIPDDADRADNHGLKISENQLDPYYQRSIILSYSALALSVDKFISKSILPTVFLCNDVKAQYSGNETRVIRL